jgi:hypothetical protein
MFLYCVCDRARQLGERVHLEGKGWESAVAIMRFQGCSRRL